MGGGTDAKESAVNRISFAARRAATLATFALCFAAVTACGDDEGASTGPLHEGGSGGAGGTSSRGGAGGMGGGAQPVVVTIQNAGDGAMEGHTPRGFQGQGTGLFAGDNLNPNFPEGDGVQIFLTFDLAGVPSGAVQSAILRSANGSVSGTPYVDLGNLSAEEMRFDAFSSALWNQAPEATGNSCVFATSAAGPHECDIGSIVARSLTDAYPNAQVRLRFDTAGDSDGSQDLALFFITNSNTNEPGIFELEVTVVPD
jgi:hypothetical protein